MGLSEPTAMESELHILHVCFKPKELKYKVICIYVLNSLVMLLLIQTEGRFLFLCN